MSELNFLRSWRLFFTISVFIVQSFAQFPPECATETSLLVEKRCCPVNSDTGLVCGGSGRGVCQFFDNKTIESRCVTCPEYEYRDEDDRAYWPYKFFHEWCVCEWPFQGPSCNECVWGFYGEECDTRRVLVRTNILKTENKQLMEDTLKYMQWMKQNVSNDYVIATCTLDVMQSTNTICYENTTYYDFLVWVHWYSAVYYNTDNSSNHNIQDFIHPSSVFPVWHRLLMLIWERVIQKLSGDDQYALPYYEWIGDPFCSICTEDKFGLSAGTKGLLTENSPFSSWKTICDDNYSIYEGELCDTRVKSGGIVRFPGQGYISNFPGEEQLEATLNWPLFDAPPYNYSSTDSFRNIFYGSVSPYDGISTYDSLYNTIYLYMHAAGHFVFNGTMTSRTISLNDPIFGVYHCYVDMVFEMWIQRWGGLASYEAYPITGATQQNNRYDFLVTVFPPVVVDSLLVGHSSELGYVYEDI